MNSFYVNRKGLSKTDAKCGASLVSVKPACSSLPGPLLIQCEIVIVDTSGSSLVSNLTVTRLIKKSLLGATLALSAVVLLVFLASQVEQHFFRRRAELLLTQIQSLELGKTPWSQTKGQLKNWDAESTFDDSCNESECLADVRLVEPVYGFVTRTEFFAHLDDYIRWRLKLSSSDTGPVVRLELALLRGYMLLGGRPARIVAFVGMRDGIVSSKGYSVEIQTYWPNIRGLLPWDNFALIAAERTVSEFDLPDTNHLDPQLNLHPGYRIWRQAGCCDFEQGNVEFTPRADPNDIRRLMRLNLSCLTQIRPCASLSDIMPAAWEEYRVEHPGE